MRRARRRRSSTPSSTGWRCRPGHPPMKARMPETETTMNPVLKLFDLSGRIALVTGSSAGIGLALAHGLAGAGATVVLNGRNDAKLQQAAAKLRDEGATVHAFAFDVTSADATAAAVERIEQEVGAIDILVNNAGMH